MPRSGSGAHDAAEAGRAELIILLAAAGKGMDESAEVLGVGAQDSAPGVLASTASREAFPDYFNATMAKPSRWIMKGKPLTV